MYIIRKFNIFLVLQSLLLDGGFVAEDFIWNKVSRKII